MAEFHPPELTAYMQRVGNEFAAAAERMCDALIATLTPEQRDHFNGLMACGTPILDAICESIDLSHGK